MELTEKQLNEMRDMKAHFPYRIVYGALKGSEFITSAVTTKRVPNRLAREGWKVWLLK